MTNDIFEIVEEKLKDKLSNLETCKSLAKHDSINKRSADKRETSARLAAEYEKQIDKLTLLLELWKDVRWY